MFVFKNICTGDFSSFLVCKEVQVGKPVFLKGLPYANAVAFTTAYKPQSYPFVCKATFGMALCVCFRNIYTDDFSHHSSP